MELNVFITQALNKIAEGVKESKEHFKQIGGAVSPEIKKPTGPIDNTLAVFDDHYKYITCVEFEVNLTYEEKNGNTAGIGVLLGTINLGGRKEGSNTDNLSTKIKFSVPVILP